MNIDNPKLFELSLDQASSVAGGDAESYAGGYTLGTLLGTAYWGARNYMSETVYPYYLD